MARWNQATWQGLPRNHGPALRPTAVTLHHQAGSGNPYNIYLARGVSAHFWIRRDGRVWQHVDTGRQSWHGRNHNGSAIGVETEGCGAPPHAEPLTDAQLTAFGDLMRWANRTHGIPLQESNAVGAPGLNYHRARGFSGATACPCDVRRNARAEILRRARSGPSPQPAPPAPPQPAPPPAPTPGEEHTVNRIFFRARNGTMGVAFVGAGYWVRFTHPDQVEAMKNMFRRQNVEFEPNSGFTEVDGFLRYGVRLGDVQ